MTDAKCDFAAADQVRVPAVPGRDDDSRRAPTYNVPCAGDDAIFADILAQFRPRCGTRPGGDAATWMGWRAARFADLDSARREAVADRLRETGGLALKMLTRIILQCYYRDDRVMRSLDMEVRPPFPIGFELEQGDWSLLDPVRVRPKLYREVS